MADDSDIAVPACDQSKTCTKCGEHKLLAEFNRHTPSRDGRRPDCRECQRKRANANSAKTKDKRNAAGKRYYAENRELIRQKQKRRSAEPDQRERNKEYQREYYQQNRKRVLARMKVQRADRPTPLSPERKAKKKGYNARYKLSDRQKAANVARAAIWIKENPERYREILKRHRQKRRANPKAMLENFVRNGVYRSIRHGSKAGRRTFEILGYTVDQLKRHIERQLTDGMSWANYGDWHIDHKIPLAAFNYETPDHVDFKRAWALTNLQPMWANDNKRKNAKLFAPFQPSLMMP